MPSTGLGAARDIDRHFRRLVWVLAGVIAITAGVFYYGKAADERSAFIRWRPQVLKFWQGENIYDRQMFPNPPIMPISLYPLMALPPVQGAMCWFGLKVAAATVSILLCFRMVRPGERPLPSWFQAGVLVFCLRPFLSDLHHGNNNLIILFLIVAMLEAWRKGYDVLSGLLLALAISYKVTPALFVPYFLYKRSWRTVGATALGMGFFLLIVPGLVIGPQFNGQCLGMWWHRMLRPFLVKGAGSPQEINQSMIGVMTRLLTESKTGTGRYDVHLDLNLLSLHPDFVKPMLKAMSLVLVGVLAFFCRTRTDRRDDPRLLGEFALIVLAMLFMSERSWKHHYVTLLLPYTYLMAQFTFGSPKLLTRLLLAAAMWISVGLMATTSSEMGGLLAQGQGHKIAQGYGMFLWAGVLLFVVTAWRVWAQRFLRPAAVAPSALGALPKPHFEEAPSKIAAT